MNEYLTLRFRLLTKSCFRNLGQMVLVAAVLMACVMLGTVLLHLSMKHSFNLRAPEPESLPPAPRASPIVTPTPTKQDSSTCNYKETGSCPIRSLFHDEEVHRVVTDNLMRTASRLLTQADYEIVQEFAWMGFQKIN